MTPVGTPEWAKDCERWRGPLLTGKYAHWCYEWDGLPVDETTMEFDCCSCWEVGATEEELAALAIAKQHSLERSIAFWSGLDGLGE
jgi:hypothetical protein